jgi:hypothetical protein
VRLLCLFTVYLGANTLIMLERCIEHWYLLNMGLFVCNTKCYGLILEYKVLIGALSCDNTGY